MKKPSRPSRQVCPLCGTDDGVDLRSDGPDLWTFICTSEREHHPYEWKPAWQPSPPPGRSGLAEELGLYDDLLRCVAPGECLEYGIVEYRLAQTSPQAYRRLVEQYGHVSLQPTRYTASSFVAHVLGQLAQEGLLTLSWTKGTGYWSYLTRVSAWSLTGGSVGEITSWSEFATAAGEDVESWPPTSGW